MNRVLFVIAVLAVIGAVVAGLVMVGGPAHARMEKNDSLRAYDLAQFGDGVHCNQESMVLPDTLEGYELCRNGGNMLRDPVTDIPYEYRKQDENMFEVCATFELPESDRRRGERRFRKLRQEDNRGCLRFGRENLGAEWRAL